MLDVALFIFVLMLFGIPIFLMFARLFGLYATVEERRCRVYVLFGKVLGVLEEPGLHILPLEIGPAAFIVNLLGKCYIVDMRLDQEYRRSEPVNSEEGAPIGIGIWYEMWISDPVAYLFRNTSVPQHGSTRVAAGQREQRHGPVPEQHAAGGHARDAQQDEPNGARRSLAEVPRVGLQAGIGVHPEGPFP